MRICITGGAGYVGAVLARQFPPETVTVLDRFPQGAPGLLGMVPVKLVHGDVRNGLPDDLRMSDVVIHLAAIVGAPACAADPEEAYAVNVEGTRAVVRGLSKGQRFIYASTGSVYGAVNGVCTEDSPTAPLSVYGRTKLEGERIAVDAGGLALRFATLYGVSPAMRLDLLLNDFCWQAWRYGRLRLFEGGHRRTFMHVWDAVGAYRHFLYTQTGVINIGDPGLGLTKREAAEAVARVLPLEIEEAPEGSDPDQRDYAVSYTRQDRAGFQCPTPLLPALDDLVRVMPACGALRGGGA